MRKIIEILFLLIFINHLQCKKNSYGKFGKIRKIFSRANVGDIPNAEYGTTDINYSKHPCKRECYANQTMTCYYYMVVHNDETFTPSCFKYLQAKYRYVVNGEEYLDDMAIRNDIKDEFDDCKYIDGFGKDLLLVNGHFPGFSIEVCEGDTIVADVINSLLETTSMHWHGMLQHTSPHMDGVPHVTQYPIAAGQAFRYRFLADHPGTNWWHSHTEHQRAYGLAGALIVRQPKIYNLHAKLYDYDLTDHIIILQDWTDDYYWSIPKQLIINGHGRRNLPTGDKPRPILYSTFTITRGGRYRFRIISNGVTNCPLTLSIDQHDLVVISSDGNDIEPVTVQKLSIHGGERFDVVLHANQRVDNYWIRIKGYGFCIQNELHQEAILSYLGAKSRTLPKSSLSYSNNRRGIELNPAQFPAGKDAQKLSLAELNTVPSHTAFSRPHHTYYSQMYLDTSIEPIFQMDRISFSMEGFSLLQTRNLGNNRLFCNKTQLAASGRDCRKEKCRCTNVVEVPAFSNIEFVFSSVSIAAHPIHLHGYSFQVVGMGLLGKDKIEEIEQIDKRTPLPRRLKDAPIKDTVQVPGFGYTIVRFYTDNPGYWIFHCHISTHSESGMSAVMRVGTAEQMRMCPVSNCGLCSSVF